MNHFLSEIFYIESKGMLNDLICTPTLFPEFSTLNKIQLDKGLNYIKSILKECYDSGGMQVAIINDNEELLGYTIFFTPVKPDGSAYLHKIFVKKEFRGNGIGSSMLSEFTNKEFPISLLCSRDKKGFYENYGFQFIQNFRVPASDEFKLSSELYNEFCVMCTSSVNHESSIFLLNDNDLKIILDR